MSSGSTEVVGVDACRGGWIAVTVRRSGFAACAFFSRFEELVGACGAATVIGVDIPIGLAPTGTRAADLAAKEFLGKGSSSVFLVPPRPVLTAPTYLEARTRARELGEPGVSAQAYALRSKILEVEAVGDARTYEVHPEVSFRALAGRPLRARKKTWAGVWERVALLRSAGTELPAELGEAGKVGGVDDVLDAAVVAWSALRIVSGKAKSLPRVAERVPDGGAMAIWY
jgi:predicted RNase H-like nuclease